MFKSCIFVQKMRLVGLIVGSFIALGTGCNLASTNKLGTVQITPTDNSMPLAVPTPNAPATLTALASSRKLALHWTAGNDSAVSNFADTRYDVWRQAAGDIAATRIAQSLNALAYDDVSLANAQSYTYSVRAVRGGQTSADSPKIVGVPDVLWSAFSTTSFDEWRESLASVRNAGTSASPSVSLIASTVSHEYGALAPNGMIYTVPWGGTSVGKINTTLHSVSILSTAVPNGQYLRPILAPNGKLYVFGLDSGLASFRIDPSDDSITTLSIPAYSGTRSFWGAALGKNGRIYAVPAGYGATGKILEYDPATETSAYRFAAYNSPQFTFTFPTYGSDGFLYLVPRISGQPMQKITFDTNGTAAVTTVASSTFAYVERPLPDLFGGLLAAFPSNEQTSTYEGFQRFNSGGTDWTNLALVSNVLQGRHVCLGANEKYYWVNLNNKITEYDPRTETTTEISTGEVLSQSDHTTHYDCIVGPEGDIYWGGGYGSSPTILRLDLHLNQPPSPDALLYPFWH